MSMSSPKSQLWCMVGSCGLGLILCKYGRYRSTLEHVNILIVSNYVLLACINTISKYSHSWMIK